MASFTNPECPQCGNFTTVRMDLDVRPAVFSCPACWNAFTQGGKSVPGPSKRSIRIAASQRFDQIAADVHHFVADLRAIRGLGIFDDDALDETIYELDQTVWQVMVDCRLQLPESPRRRVPKTTLIELRKLRSVREWQREKEAEELKRQIREAARATKEAATHGNA